MGRSLKAGVDRLSTVDGCGGLWTDGRTRLGVGVDTCPCENGDSNGGGDVVVPFLSFADSAHKCWHRRRFMTCGFFFLRPSFGLQGLSLPSSFPLPIHLSMAILVGCPSTRNDPLNAGTFHSVEAIALRLRQFGVRSSRIIYGRHHSGIRHLSSFPFSLSSAHLLDLA